MSRRHRGFGERVYVGTNAEGVGEVYSPDEKRVVSWAVKSGGPAFLFEGGPLDNPVENPSEDPSQRAYELSGLPDVCMAKYGVDRLTADLVDSIPLLEAQRRLRPYLPPSGVYKPGWSSMPNELPEGKKSELRGYGMLGANGKLTKGANFEDREVRCFGLSLAPHRSGLRPVGLPSDTGFAFFEAPGSSKAFVNTERGKDYLFAVSSQDGDNPLHEEFGGPKRDDGRLGVEVFSGVETPVKRPTLCAFATGGKFGCIANCLVHSGQNPASDQALRSKLGLTAALYADPAAFCKVLLETIRRCFYYGGLDKKRSMFVRLNVFSDIPWEQFFPDLIDPYKKLALRQFDTQRKQYSDWRDRPVVGRGSFYDYTKVPRRMASFVATQLQQQYPRKSVTELYKAASDYYWLTFSYSGSNFAEAEQVLNKGGTVAAVFVATEAVKGGGGAVEAPLVAVRKGTVERLAYDYGFLRRPSVHSAVKHLWMYASDNSQSRTFRRVLEEYGAQVPEYQPRRERMDFAAKLISEIVGREVPPSALELGLSKAGVRSGFLKTWWYPFSFFGRPVINADANDLRGMDRALIRNAKLGRAQQVAKLQAAGQLGEELPGTVVGLEYKPPYVKTETDYWRVMFKRPKTKRGKGGRVEVVKPIKLIEDEVDYLPTKEEADRMACDIMAREGHQEVRIKKAGRMKGAYLDLAKSKFVTGVERTPDGQFVAPQTPWATDRGQE